MFNKNKEIPVDSAAGNRIGTVFSLGSWQGYGDNKELPSDSTHPYNAVYHAKGISNTPFGRVSLGWHATVESAQAALRDHHEGQKQRYQRAADLHRRDADHHQRIRDSMQDSYVPRSKLAIIKEAIRGQQPVEEQTEAEKHTWFAQQHTHAANQLEGRIASLNDRFNSAVKQSKEFPGVSGSTSIEAHRRNINFWQAKADGHREDAAWHAGKAKELTPAAESYVSERTVANFQVLAPGHDDDGKFFTRREDAIARIKKIKKTHPDIRSSIKSLHAESKKEDEETSVEIKAHHWIKAKNRCGPKYGYNPRMPTKRIPTHAVINGKTVNPRAITVYVAKQLALKGAEYKEKMKNKEVEG